ncbi:potassium channel family protein [Streptomyces sp. SP17BM10]|uniref:potassium channel family protein n=1 Tax=Streptomyces sp. SP17BM10 TaxID=3002530 RepID=UPI002E7A26B3|nr:potassium channel family protein [Streptomyces sp. SP17BM10]MEE1786841.1 potassium channel family protein [Streptomyces sp. SP17BM10]
MSQKPHRIDLRAAGWLLGSLTALMTAYFTLPLHFLGGHRPVLSWCILIGALTALSGLLLAKIRGVLRGTTRQPVAWLIFVICLSVVIFAATYYVFAAQQGEFEGLHSRLDGLYFTVVTLATVGYGDITPAGQGARLVVIIQIVYNFVFLASAAGTLSRTIRSNVETRLQREDGP